MNGTPSRPPAGERVQDLLDDPIVQLVMRRDGLTRDDVLSVMFDMRRRLFGASNARCVPPPNGCKAVRLAA